MKRVKQPKGTSRFKEDDTVSIVSGPHRGKDTTIAFVDGDMAAGYYCGKLISFKLKDARYYNGK